MAVFCAGGAYLLCFVALAIKRCRYPFELEWMEGGVLEHIRRVARGEPLYVRPSIDFVPFIYTPFFYFVSAGMSKILGVGFLCAASCLIRLVISGVRVDLFDRAERNGQPFRRLAATSLFVGTYRLTETFMDLARVDALFLALFLGGIYFFRFSKSIAGLVTGAMRLLLSFMTKQTALLMLLPCCRTSLRVTSEEDWSWVLRCWR